MSEYTDIPLNDASGNFGDKMAQSFIDESRRVRFGLIRTAPTVLELTYNLPDDRKIIDGFVILLSEKEMDQSTYPSAGIRYVGSTNYAAPLSNIGHAKVVYSRYGIFGDTVDDVGTFSVTNVDPNKVYYASIHPTTNVLDYYVIGIHSYVILNNTECTTPTHTGSIPSACVPPTNPTVGQVYYDLNTNTVSMWNGAIWAPAGTGSVITGSASARPTSTSNPPVAVGDFFYNVDTKDLEIWNGTVWVKANTTFEGIPMYDKIGIGTDGTYDERLNLADVLRKQLGYPALCVELSEDQFNIAIDNALEEFRRRADNAYVQKFIMFPLVAGQQLYYLNDPRMKTDKIVEIINIHRVNIFNVNSMANSIDASVIAQHILGAYYSTMATLDILSVHLITAMGEDYERIFAGNLMFNWNENTRELFIMRNIASPEKVILEAVVERTEQELLRDRYAKQWLQAWAESELILMLGQIRSKYGNLPGPNGGITLNGSELLSMGETMQVELLRQLQDFEVGNGGVNFGNAAFLIG